MEKAKFTHARKIYAGGGYKIPLSNKEGGCYQERIVSSLHMERKEVSACSIHRDIYE